YNESVGNLSSPAPAAAAAVSAGSLAKTRLKVRWHALSDATPGRRLNSMTSFASVSFDTGTVHVLWCSAQHKFWDTRLTITHFGVKYPTGSFVSSAIHSCNCCRGWRL